MSAREKAIGDHSEITSDLMKKVADDVIAAVHRTLAIAPDPLLPIAVSAGAACVGIVWAMLENLSDQGRTPGAAPDPECLMLAGLIVARVGIKQEDPIGAAYKDMDALRKTGRLAARPGDPQ